MLTDRQAGPGVYLEDGVRLWWIVRVDERRHTVLLENAGHPSLPLIEVAVKTLAADGFRVVPKNPQK